jgi:hypothetical protein
MSPRDVLHCAVDYRWPADPQAMAAPRAQNERGAGDGNAGPGGTEGGRKSEKSLGGCALTSESGARACACVRHGAWRMRTH